MDGELTMKLDRIVGALDPVVIVDYLRNLNCFDYEDLIKQVDYYVEAKRMLFLLTVLFLFWKLDFKKALKILEHAFQFPIRNWHLGTVGNT